MVIFVLLRIAWHDTKYIYMCNLVHAKTSYSMRRRRREEGAVLLHRNYETNDNTIRDFESHIFHKTFQSKSEIERKRARPQNYGGCWPQDGRSSIRCVG